MTRGSQVIGLTTARKRSGPQSWEVAHLFAAPGQESELPELLEEMCRRVASRGGERVFVRLRRDDSLADEARLSGFFPCFSEVLYERPPRPDTPDTNEVSASHINTSEMARKKRDGDEHALFQLFNLSTPAEVRSVIGMTFDRWRASREQSSGRRQEFVMEKNGVLAGWLMVLRQSNATLLTASIRPDVEEDTDAIVDFGLQLLHGVGPVYWLSAEYQVTLQRSLQRRRFKPVTDYVTAVKSTVASVRDGGRVRATVASR